MTTTKFSALMLDLDGTLIGRDERISPRVGEAVREASRHLEVSIATGREPADVLRFARELGLTAPQISDNGALILDPADGSEVWSAPLDPKQAQNIITDLEGQGVSFIATHPGGSVTDFTRIPHWNITRVSALDMEEAHADEMVARFSLSGELHVVKVFLPYNAQWAVDFTRFGVDKATALRVLADIRGVETSEMIGAGDSYNDIPMLQACGLRVVMGDAPDELKALADYIAPSVDEDGLAVAIEEFVLPTVLRAR